MTGMQPEHPTEDALTVLLWHWGEEYEISEAGGVWRAVRRDNQQPIEAGNADDLRYLIIADYATNPISRDSLR